MKKILIVFLMVFSVISLTACGDSSKQFLLKEASEKQNFNNNDYYSEELLDYINKIDHFSSKISESLYSISDGNYCSSPISIYMGLAMTLECSLGNTRNEILNALGVTYEEVSEYTKYIYSYCNRKFFGDSKKDLQGLELLSNSIWFEESIVLKESGLTSLADNYNCNSYAVPFKKDNNKANNALSDFIKDKTKGLINGKLDCKPSTLIVLLNTFYLKDVWNHIGDDLSFTSNEYNFLNYSSDIISKKFLQGYYNPGKVIEKEAYKHFYTNTENGFTINFILPNDGYSIDEVYNEENINNIHSISSYNPIDDKEEKCYYTRCIFPEFEAKFDKDIRDVLYDDFGIVDLFSTDCDFTNITDTGVLCSNIIHKTKLKVDKTGIEGAAITAVIMPESDAPDEYEKVYADFVIDKAFGFTITDRLGNTLFSGVVKNI